MHPMFTPSNRLFHQGPHVRIDALERTGILVHYGVPRPRK
jgi:hypothetical protein